MNRIEKSGGKLFLQWDTHSKQTSRGLCMLMERQCLVDIALSCGSNTMHAHKCVLAANSSYFKEHFENKAIEQVIINGLDFAVMKAVIEFLYSGECVVAEEHLKHFIAAVKMFKIAALEILFNESEYQNVTADEVSIPPPQFICKPPKYPTVYKPFTNTALPPKVNYALNNAYNQHKFKRKCLGSEAEKACAKEAQASRIALANLRKVMASTPQVHSFIVEESFNETTVENFIPSVEDNYSENLHEVQYVNGNLPATSTAKAINLVPMPLANNSQGLTADKIKHILGNDEVEIMFQTSDGNFVNVSDEVLLNLSKGGLQYQVVDEHGHVGELQELKSLASDTPTTKNHNFDREQILKTEDNFDLSVIKSNDDEIEKLTKSMSEEYIDPNCTKSNLEGLTTFNENLYENNFHMQNSEIFEPENLSMHSALIADNPIGFDELKYKYLSTKIKNAAGPIDMDTTDISCFKKGIIDVDCEKGDIKSHACDNVLSMNADTIKTSPHNNTSLKFTPDMFFADLPGNECTEGKVEPPAEKHLTKQ